MYSAAIRTSDSESESHFRILIAFEDRAVQRSTNTQNLGGIEKNFMKTNTTELCKVDLSVEFLEGGCT